MGSVRFLKSLWIWGACSFLVVIWVPLLAAIRLADREPMRLRTGRWFRRLGRNIARIAPWRIRISGLENLRRNKVYVIVSNHQSLADIPIISFLKVDTKWLAKAALFRFPLVGWMLRMAGDVPVERTDARARAKARQKCAQYLRRGCSVVFFPEGTRSRDGQVLPFSLGAFQLAIRERVPILPLVVDGSAAALPRNSWLFGKSSPISLRVLSPVMPETWGPDRSAELRDRVRQSIVDELDRLRQGLGPIDALDY